MVDLKTKYNEKLARYRKAAAYMGSDALLDEREKHVAKFRALMYELNDIIQQIKEAGHEMTGEEIRGGFTL